jgi:hypothetical protein
VSIVIEILKTNRTKELRGSETASQDCTFDVYDESLSPEKLTFEYHYGPWPKVVAVPYISIPIFDLPYLNMFAIDTSCSTRWLLDSFL